MDGNTSKRDVFTEMVGDGRGSKRENIYEKVADGNASKGDIFTKMVADGRGSKRDIFTEKSWMEVLPSATYLQKGPRGRDGIGCPLTVTMVNIFLEAVLNLWKRLIKLHQLQLTCMCQRMLRKGDQPSAEPRNQV